MSIEDEIKKEESTPLESIPSKSDFEEWLKDVSSKRRQKNHVVIVGYRLWIHIATTSYEMTIEKAIELWEAAIHNENREIITFDTPSGTTKVSRP